MNTQNFAEIWPMSTSSPGPPGPRGEPRCIVRRMRSFLLPSGLALALSSSLLACGADVPPAATPPPPLLTSQAAAAVVASALPSLPQVATSPTASPSSAAIAGPPVSGLHATAAMKLEGDVDTDKIVPAINTQVAALQRCVAAIRATDKVVGSLNLEITVAEGGKVKTDLQSPVNPAAKTCLLDGVRAWSVKGAGAGKAMLLLNLE